MLGLLAFIFLVHASNAFAFFIFPRHGSLCRLSALNANRLLLTGYDLLVTGYYLLVTSYCQLPTVNHQRPTILHIFRSLVTCYWSLVTIYWSPPSSAEEFFCKTDFLLKIHPATGKFLGLTEFPRVNNE